MRTRLLRTLTASIAAVLLAVCGVSLAACSSGPSAEELIREDVTSSFDLIKNLDDEALGELSASLEDASLEQYGIDPESLIRSMLDGFDYTVDSVTADDQAATGSAQLTVTCKSMTDLYGKIEGILAELMNDPEFLEIALDETRLNERVGELVLGAVDQIEPTEKHLDLSYTKTDDGWQLDESAAAEVAQIFV